MPFFLLVLVLGGVALAASQSSAAKTPADDAALAADLAEIPDPVLREQVLKLLFTAQRSDVPALQTLASTLEAKGYKRAAARLQAKIYQLQLSGPPPQPGYDPNPTPGAK